MSPAPTLSVVLPCLNEGAHLERSLATLSGVLDALALEYELVLVDDGSSDDTWEVLVRLARANPRLRAVRLSRRFGKELALTAGLEQARGAGVLVMDADLQHPPALIPEMVRAWRDEGFEVVEAVKTRRAEEPLLARLGAKLFYPAFRRLSGFDLEGASDFKLVDRRVLAAWAQMGERNVFFRGMSAWLGFRRKAVPFEVAPRAGGRSGWSPWRLLRLAVNGITAFSSAPLQLVTAMGLVFLLFAVGVGLQTLYNWFCGRAATGFTTVIVLVLIVGSCIMIGLGVIGLYLSRIYEEVKGRPRYVVRDQTGPRVP
ncbi:MAG: glycosyltransferase [Planctomycetes bacterium]|nr:glycosyltransferase [Planctomycetota bacterium]